MSELSNLIAELEKAEAGSRELDALIHDAVEWLQRPEDEPPHYTTSIDAALTIIPKGHEWSAGLAVGRGRANVWVPNPLRSANIPASPTKAATPALALCIAALKAREAGQ